MSHQEHLVCVVHTSKLNVHLHPGCVSAVSTVSHWHVEIQFFDKWAHTHSYTNIFSLCIMLWCKTNPVSWDKTFTVASMTSRHLSWLVRCSFLLHAWPSASYHYSCALFNYCKWWMFVKYRWGLKKKEQLIILTYIKDISWKKYLRL